MNRRAKSCGKDGRKAPLEIPSGFPLFAQLQQQQLDDRDHFQQNAKTSVASLRGLIGSSRNIDRHHSGMLIDFIGIPNPALVPEILKIEDVNFLDSNPNKRFRQLFGYAISPKRYALY